MPFVKEKFTVSEKTPAFLFIMRTFGFTQAQAQRLVGKGRLLIAGVSIYNSGTKLEPGEVEIVYFKAASRGEKPLFANKDFMVFEKPSGVLVHPNTMSTPYSMLDEIRHIGGDNANAVHRIDMETSGLLLASKHKQSEHYLKNAFEIKKIRKSYLAWVDGELTAPFSVTLPIKINHDYSECKHKVFLHGEGKYAHTNFKPIHYDKTLDATLVACYPLTGRTHQIRVHLFHVKHPILGDPLYGTTFKTANAYLEDTLTQEERFVHTGAQRLMLHAQTLTFPYGAKYQIESKVNFGEMKALICPQEERLFNTGSIQEQPPGAAQILPHEMDH
ncbi:Ribosomal large subunit pseudouridine synthase D [hydrothermal vent metagenome]|uniref:Ribosomal large subunit pseudouridine synthase D n=1 Tax=hydrothermal vent metagenome TaxID=652676 RepID=A0A1W1BV49_9ZZZZ